MDTEHKLGYLYKLFSSPEAVKHYGLYNQGATCYLNSVLQVLFMTREFREAVSSFTGNPGTERFIDAALKALFDDLRRGTTCTDKIIGALKIDSTFEQRDAAEYFEKILNQMQNPDAAKIFCGQMAHRTTCSICLTENDTDGQFCHLPFELQGSFSGNYSVVDGIEKYFQPSYFNGDNQMYCDNCDCKVEASSKYVIKHHPDVLVLLLKRFDFSYRYMSYVKIQCDVDVPFTLNTPQGQRYELYAVVNHFGDLRGGHYSATIKSQDEDRWFCFDDSRVSPLDRSPFTDKPNISRFPSAYLLFYRKTADIQEKINKPNKRSRDDNTDENEQTNNKETKKTKRESDTEDQDEKKTHPEDIELTKINQTTAGVIIHVKPGDRETSADTQDDRSGPPGGFRDGEGTKIKNETENTCFHEKNVTANNNNAGDQSDQNTDREPEKVGLIGTNEIKAHINPEPGDNETSADIKEDMKDPPGGFIGEETGNSDSHEDMMSKNSDQIKDKSPPSTGEQAVGKEPGENKVTNSNQMTAPGDCERSPLPAVGKLIHLTSEENKQTETDHEQDIKSKHGDTEPQEEHNDVETEEKRQKNEVKNSNFHEKNINWTNNEQKKDKHLLPFDVQNKVTDPENVRTETTEEKPDVTPERGDSGTSAESQSPKINTTDEVQQTEISDRHEDRASEVIDPFKAKLTEIIQMTQAMKISPKPGDSEGSAVCVKDSEGSAVCVKDSEGSAVCVKDSEGSAVCVKDSEGSAVSTGDSEGSAVSTGHDTQDDMSDAQRLTINTITDNIEQTETSDSHGNQTSKNSEQIEDSSLSSTGEQTEVEEPGEAELTNINQRSSTHRGLVGVKTDENKPTETSPDQGMESTDRNTEDRAENRPQFSTETPQAEVTNPEESEQIETVEIKPVVKTGGSKRSTEPVVIYSKTRSHEKQTLLDKNIEEHEITAMSSERTEQNMTTKDDDVNKPFLDNKVQITIDDEGGAERKPCCRQWKYIVMGILAVVLALILLIVVFTVRL